MEEPYRTGPEPPPRPRPGSPWWREAEWPSYRETKDGIGYLAATVILGMLVGPMAGGVVARALGQVGKDGYATSEFLLGGMLGGLVVGLVAGGVSVVWGTSRLRQAVALGLLLAGGLLLGGQAAFPPRP